ncbi:MAG: DUF971 domain-containing protein [Gemmatimonadetes bacterium]|nr:DUF971 domain-containing protein [Gemmatimonadota bacterium]MYD63090.1 DUF971 domain-containing protein [Gemmatimonadota bacterium]
MAEKPKRIRVDRTEGWLEMDWADDGILRVQLSDVRKACPCALCGDVRTKQDEQLQMITADQTPSADLSDVIPVGNYAIQIRWTDGHDTGIYTYSYLKQLALASCR